MPTSASLTPGFMVLHGNRLEDLRDLLTGFLRQHPLPPLWPEIFLVQSAGMKHWLELSLADEAALGICAATRMELPSAYLWQVYRQVLGPAAVPAQMPFDKASLLWRLVRLLPDLVASRPIYQPLQRYLDQAPDARKLYQLALQLADVLDGYQSYRADWLSDWAQGRDVLGRPNTLPTQAPALDASQAWQAQLWRDLRADVGEALADASRAAVHARFMARLAGLTDTFVATGERPPGLPARIVVFGISSLPHQAVEALAALGQLTQVMLLVHNPCQFFWGDLVEGHEQLRQLLRRRQPVKAAALAQATPGAAHHPLLASWGKQGRDYLHMLDEFDRVEDYRNRFVRVDAFVDPLGIGSTPTQLTQLQSGLLNLELPSAPLPLAEDDDSVRLVSCHSAQREVEVLHDRLLAWLDADPSLQPREVMVMVPDIATFAPHIQAVFGRFARGEPRHIPYSVADTSPRQSPLVMALQQLLSLPQARISLADWLSLFEVSAVRHRFGLSEVEVDEVQTWLQAAGVRWGLDTEHRLRWGLPPGVPGLAQNTWDFGLRRLLLGYAVGSGPVWAGTLPQPALSGLDAPLAQALWGWVEATRESLDTLAQPHTPSEWVRVLSELVARFFDGADEAEARQVQALLEPLQTWLQHCQAANLDSPLPLEVVSDHWLGQLQDGGLQQRFLGGGVQFGTLMPMRSIPFRVVCLLGLNDGDYPRQSAPRDFDLMASSWRAGDRSRREDDRYLFLEALLSARERLYISWQGHRATDNAERPPSVLVAQLIEFLHRHWTPARAPQVQPLQPFSAAYFSQGSGFATYDEDWARAQAAEPAAGAGVAAPAALEATVPSVLTLNDLRQLLRQPVEVFFKGRLGVYLDELEEHTLDSEPFGLDGLEKYQLGQEVLAADTAPQVLTELLHSGRLPMAAFGQREVQGLQTRLSVVQQRLAPLEARFPFALPAQSVDLSIELPAEPGQPPEAVQLLGTLSGLFCEREERADTAPADCAPGLQRSQRLGAVLQGKESEAMARVQVLTGLWVSHLAGCAAGLRLNSTVLGLDGQIGLRPLSRAQALACLQRLVVAYRAAWQRPLPVACQTGWAYWQAARRAEAAELLGPAKREPRDPHEAARAAFEGSFQLAGERLQSPYLQRCTQAYEDLQAELPDWAEQLYGDLARHLRIGPLPQDEGDEGAASHPRAEPLDTRAAQHRP
ncbi:exodeoxyribonuclease V subunit gamma [Curvibacter sp. RS43]|uniref:exodeoxyribonuclease V subunit gamma n=1 Tax=Curvibacter microcysteis TaxID=3026419 RepID=UPI0023609660|nr:exodeoxyribonuclease V subunit gamma [Curvibacter sp. RS43]MDD0809439.1 exodeoxyribonuclease V subunit gamma [Curvibacter sp. RS43]